MNDHDILMQLDRRVRSPAYAAVVDAAIPSLEAELEANPERVMSWTPLPGRLLDGLPPDIRSAWVFVLRAGTTTGAERHPNSHQRMMSYRGAGDFPTRTTGDWTSHPLVSDPSAPMGARWISIPPDVWHQGIVGGAHWVVVSFHTVPADELIEERPGDEGTTRKTYV